MPVRPTITVLVLEDPDGPSEVCTAAGGVAGLGVEFTESIVGDVVVHSVAFDSYPSTRYCTEPGEYVDYPTQAEALAAHVEATAPATAVALRELAARFRERNPELVG